MSAEERSPPPKCKLRIKIDISPIRRNVTAAVQDGTVLSHTELVMRYFCGIATPQVVTELDATIKALGYIRGSLDNTKLATWIRNNIVISHKDPLVRVLGAVQHQGNIHTEKIKVLEKGN